MNPARVCSLLLFVLAGCAAPLSGRAVQAPTAAVSSPGLTRQSVSSTEAARAAEAYCARAAAADAACPPLARLRPSEGWPLWEAQRRQPPRDEAEARLRERCRCLAKKKSLWLASATPVFIFAYGLVFWNYGDGSFGTTDEGWFERDTKHGGADKTGHFVAGTIWTAGMAAIHRKWGFSRREAAFRGALTALAALAAIEVADGSSGRQGFSYSDLISDMGGCLAGYLHETSPWVNRVIDFRWEYWPTERAIVRNDPTTDYERSSHLVAFNVGGLLSRDPTLWDLLDVQVGYRARGYEKDPRDHEQWVFVGLGLNVANLLRRAKFPYAGVFDYFQLPYVSLRVGFELNGGGTRLLWRP